MGELNKVEKIVAGGLICVVIGVIGICTTNRLIFLLPFFVGAVLLFVVSPKIRDRQLRLASPLLKGKIFVESKCTFNGPYFPGLWKETEAREYIALFDPPIQAGTAESADIIISLCWGSWLAIGHGYGKSHEFGGAGYYYCNITVKEKSTGRVLREAKIRCSTPPEAIYWGVARPAPNRTNIEFGELHTKPVKDYLLSLLEEKDVNSPAPKK